jgi:ComF family protein
MTSSQKLRSLAERLATQSFQAARGVLRAVGKMPSAARRAVVDLALPPICAGCDRDLEALDDDVLLCTTCRMAFEPPAGPICPRCAAPAAAVSIRPTGCVHCEETSFRFHHIVSLGVYDGALQQFVLRMKHQEGEPLALAVGRLLARQAASVSERPEIVTAVPMHWSRRLWRGVNSAALMAEAAAGQLQLPLALDLVRSMRLVPRQSSLTPSRRRRNMRKAFATSRAYDVAGAHVLVIDDVLTTGATANAIAQALRLAGAERVTIAVAARGIGV